MVHVLLLDDDVDMTEYLATALRKMSDDVSVTVTNSVDEARTVLTDPATPGFDLLILDEHMPGDTGSELVAHLVTYAPLANAKTVMLTGDGQDEVRNRALARNFDAFLTKPVNNARLEKLVCERRVYWEIHDLPRNLDYRTALGQKT